MLVQKKIEATHTLPGSIAIPTVVRDPAAESLKLILQIERDARRAKTIAELGLLIANETRRAIGARQVFMLSGAALHLRVEAVSSLSSIERHAPTISWIQNEAAALLAGTRGGGTALGTLKTDTLADGAGHVFPFPEAAAQIVAAPDGRLLGAVVGVRERPFSDQEAMLLQRLAETFGHAWDALERPKKRLRKPGRKVWLSIWICLATGLLGIVPIRLTALAPSEVAPRMPAVIAAPIDGAIDIVEIEPNQSIKTGDILFRYQDTQSRGALDVASREVAVAEARVRQVMQMAFVDASAKRELAVTQSELRLKRAEHMFAAEVHERTIVRAPRDGVAVFADKRELIGRPVSTGQKVMEIADPLQTHFRLNVLADDALVLKVGAQVRIFMDSDPLNPLSATLVRAMPMARVNESGVLSFRAEAELERGGTMPPLGHRGTAQISGDKVSLAFFLLRRPISTVRQRFGL
jgi:multidrug resistance efflux pump